MELFFATFFTTLFEAYTKNFDNVMCPMVMYGIMMYTHYMFEMPFLKPFHS